MIKKIFLIGYFPIAFNAFSQINSPNGNNIFYYNGAADVTFKFAPRGSGGRAFVHADNNILSLNFGSDFSGGTRIGNDVYFKDGEVSYIASGNFGIGTTSPKSKFEVTDWTTALTIGSRKNTEAMVDNEVLGAINFYKHYNIAYAGAIKLLQAGDGNQYSPAHLAFYTTGGGNPYTVVPEERMRITSAGNIGIGTTTPDSKLAVNGTIHSKEVKVDMNGWPDYVFKKEYNLPTLQEVEKHINEKGHLENIPSEEEILKNGLNLGQMNVKLLQKIEELTLYMIEMKKENEEMKKQNNLIKAENDLIKKNQIDIGSQIKNLVKK